MTGATLDGVYVVTPQNGYRSCRPSCRMRGDELPLGDIPRYDQASLAFLYADKLGKSDITHKDMEVVVVVPYRGCVRSFIVVLLQDTEGGLGINGIPLNVDNGKIACLLLTDTECPPLEASGIYPDHIAMALEEVARENEHIPHPVHSVSEILSPVGIVTVNVKV